MKTKVVVIDADIEVTEQLNLVLKPETYEVLNAKSGRMGVELVRSQNPDVVVLNTFMPGIDGWKVCREIRGFSQVPILILSAISSPELVARALDEGADEILPKPVTNNVLIAYIRRLAHRARAEKEAANSR
ncbi:MAG: response regulator [Chloroflexi bacterium]|nr:response regulator [Chloroflexota bacterium]